jgi:hypothetical protein
MHDGWYLRRRGCSWDVVALGFFFLSGFGTGRESGLGLMFGLKSNLLTPVRAERERDWVVVGER